MEVSKEFMDHVNKSYNMRLLSDACLKAAEAAVVEMEKEGQPQTVPYDKEKWRKAQVFGIQMIMLQFYQNATGQGL